MILAAGRGERMKPLTLNTPKPLLPAGGKPLLQYHIEALAAASVRDIIINTGMHGEQIEAFFGNGVDFGVSIRYSHEGDAPLETGGGIRRALPLLGDAPFMVVNADIWTDYDFSRLPVNPAGLVHLVMVDNPQHHPQGDFALCGGRIGVHAESLLTYSGIGVYDPGLFRDVQEEVFSLTPLLRKAIRAGCVTGEYYPGSWLDIGTPDRLTQLAQRLANK